MAKPTIEIGLQAPIAAVDALKKAGYNVTAGGKPVNVSEIDNKEQELQDGKGAIHTKKWDRCVKKVKASGKSEESAYRICSSVIKNAGVKAAHQRKKENEYVANRKKLNEGEPLFDIFPELNQPNIQENAESEKNKTTNSIKTTKKTIKINNKKLKNNSDMEKVMTKKEILEAIRSMEKVAPSKPAPSTPTITPTKPKPRPQRQNPFRPKPGPNPRPKAYLPKWLKADVLGIGEKKSKNQLAQEDLTELKKIIKKII